jgi:DNA polymerase III alpha subunit
MYLNCHSFHSLRYGTIPLQELVQQAVACNVKAMALTDINTVTGIYDFIKACNEVNIKPIVGMEFRCGGQLRYIALAKNRSGLGQMNRFLTDHNFDGTPLPFSAPQWEDVVVIYPLENVPQILNENEYIGIRSEQLPKLFHAQWKTLLPKMVILQPVVFRTKREFNLHRILRAIEINTLLSKLTQEDVCKTSDVMIPMEQLLLSFTEYPEIIANTQKVMGECNFEFDFKTPKNKKFYTQSRETDIALLTKLAFEGLLW